MSPVFSQRADQPTLPNQQRRSTLWQLALAGVGLGLSSWPANTLLAQATTDAAPGRPVPDIAPVQLSRHVWCIYASEGFATPQNQGMMSNVSFVVTNAGVVVIDTGSSLQIGRMAIRMIRTVTPQPVVAVFNTHSHGDHWLGNHAFAEAYGAALPICALPETMAQISGQRGQQWREWMQGWTGQASQGTEIVPPNRPVSHGQVLQFGDISLALHTYGQAHTSADLSLQVLQDRVTAIGDIAMSNRIATMDDGSYPGTLRYYKALSAAAGDQLWLPGHGQADRDLLASYGSFLSGIWEPCLLAVKAGETEAQAKARVLADPRVASRASTMQGFAANLGKYISLAYLEAEKEAF